MKDIKCPLCGEEMKLKSNVYGDKQQDLYCYECSKCPLATMLVGNVEDAEEVVKVLVSKFPPIMRLRQGDNVLVWLSDDIHTVLGTDLEAGKIHLQDVYGDADSYNPTGIKKWPWELERKGGE